LKLAFFRAQRTSAAQYAQVKKDTCHIDVYGIEPLTEFKNMKYLRNTLYLHEHKHFGHALGDTVVESGLWRFMPWIDKSAEQNIAKGQGRGPHSRSHPISLPPKADSAAV